MDEDDGNINMCYGYTEGLVILSFKLFLMVHYQVRKVIGEDHL